MKFPRSYSEAIGSKYKCRRPFGAGVKPELQDVIVSYMGYCLVRYTESGYEISLPDINSDHIKDIFTKVICKVLAERIYYNKNTDSIVWSNTDTPLTTRRNRVAIIAYDFKQAMRGNEKIVLEGRKPTSIIAKMGCKVRQDDWVITRTKHGSRVFHKGDSNNKSAKYQYDGDPFHVAKYYFYSSGSESCKECGVPFPKDVVVTAELFRRMGEK